MSVFQGKAPKKFQGKEGEEGREYLPVPSGSHGAVLVACVDLGTQRERKFQSNETEDKRKILLVWELPDAQDESRGGNFVFGLDYRVSYHEKAALRKMLEAWRGEDFTEEDPIDVLEFLEKTCLLNITHQQSADGSKTYARLKSVSPLPRGMTVSKVTLESLAWNYGDNLALLPSWLPYLYGRPVLDWIEHAIEYGETYGNTPPPQGQPAQFRLIPRQPAQEGAAPSPPSTQASRQVIGRGAAPKPPPSKPPASQPPPPKAAPLNDEKWVLFCDDTKQEQPITRGELVDQVRASPQMDEWWVKRPEATEYTIRVKDLQLSPF